MAPPSRSRLALRALYRALLAPVPFGLKLFVARRLAPNLFRYLPAGREVTVHDYLGRYTVMLDPQYPVEARMLGSRWDPGTVALIRALVHEGHVCLDVGANVGALTLAMAECVAPRGRVYAFEPGPLPYGRLVRNLRLNPSIAGCVEALPLGVADEPGTLHWHWSPDEPGNPANATMLGTTGTPVAVTSIDGYFAGRPLPRLDFVKIDVEDMEYEVLAGGRATWVAHQPILYFESDAGRVVVTRGFPAHERVEALLRGIGYALYRVDEDWRLRAVTARDMPGTTFAVPASHPTLRDGARLPAARRHW